MLHKGVAMVLGISTYGQMCFFLHEIQPVILNNAWISPFGVLIFRGEVNFVGQSDEVQGTDNEICTIAAERVNSAGRESASNKTEGLWNTINCSLSRCWSFFSILCLWRKHIIKEMYTNCRYADIINNNNNSSSKCCCAYLKPVDNTSTWLTPISS